MESLFCGSIASTRSRSAIESLITCPYLPFKIARMSRSGRGPGASGCIPSCARGLAKPEKLSSSQLRRACIAPSYSWIERHDAFVVRLRFVDRRRASIALRHSAGVFHFHERPCAKALRYCSDRVAGWRQDPVPYSAVPRIILPGVVQPAARCPEPHIMRR